jgi:CRP-like cAMP-binding protein
MNARSEQLSAGHSLESLFRALPELSSAVPQADRRLAERTLTGALLAAHDQDLHDVLETRELSAFDFIVVEGVVFKETTLLSRSALEVLGPGDVLAPPLTAIRQVESRAVSRYLAHGHVALLTLNDRFRLATSRWPLLADVLHDRLGQQTHRASMHLAMLHLPRIEDRLLALFADLGERFGRMTGDGITVPIPLTHDVIGRLVGSRRPTVSLALQSLASDGTLYRRDGHWILRADAIPV